LGTACIAGNRERYWAEVKRMAEPLLNETDERQKGRTGPTHANYEVHGDIKNIDEAGEEEEYGCPLEMIDLQEFW